MCLKLKKQIFRQKPKDAWRKNWLSIVPPECRNVPITVEGETRVAYICINHFAVMMQDGLGVIPGFFDVCNHFQKAGYHVVWLIRCTQDLESRDLRIEKIHEAGRRIDWYWAKPTTNFGRWTSDSGQVTIILQFLQEPDEEKMANSSAKILQRVLWAESDDSTKTVPGQTRFTTVAKPSSPKELRQYLEGTLMSRVRRQSTDPEQ